MNCVFRAITPAIAASRAIYKQGGKLGVVRRQLQREEQFFGDRPWRLANGTRYFSNTTTDRHGGHGKPAEGEGVTIHFKKHNGEHIKTVQANVGDDVVDVSWEWDLDIEAACEKSIACSTCHVILEPKIYDNLEEPSDEENDMLDLAFGLTDTSRLGCQVKITKEMDGMTVTLPSATRNMRVDGSKPTHH
ncbi:putative YAH1-ferredoxin of the mitochondrial matrix [Atractiella rhizophila]|nr:putative YAH1-ferredoxin of the mitochondrial matrix [Atractiella rhizophila]